ncbi:MAG: NAD-dependent epimerase/dehydratase family protein [Alphaproteobacteria bacterium]|nr:NAD-dependent epimerase/dehydratase family protein [Alphaproteobacteria bacterium]
MPLLVTGAVGQVGTDLTAALRARHGADAVIAVGHRTPPSAAFRAAGPYETVDARDRDALDRLIRKHRIDAIYHLVTLLSGAGEQNPDLAWDVNLSTLKHVLDLAVHHKLAQVFWPSSIAVFGPTTPRLNTPQRTILEPTTMYGVTKLAGENLCHYYALRYGLDVRSLRYPGLITYKTFSGGGTSDYAVEIFIAAIERKHYTFFVNAQTAMPMMYMDDAMKATLDLMAAPADHITVRTSYNLGALSFTAAELATAVARRVPGFTWDHAPDFRQAIADSWPDSVDDGQARADWGWAPDYDLPTLVDTMLAGTAKRLGAKG